MKRNGLLLPLPVNVKVEEIDVNKNLVCEHFTQFNISVGLNSRRHIK